jgi:hypothetical protein
MKRIILSKGNNYGITQFLSKTTKWASDNDFVIETILVVLDTTKFHLSMCGFLSIGKMHNIFKISKIWIFATSKFHTIILNYK